jgi:hypothetical protein
MAPINDAPSWQSIEERIARLEEAFWPFFHAHWAVCAAGESAIPALVRTLGRGPAGKTAYAPVRALGEIVRTNPTDLAINALLDWLPIQASIYPDVRQALLNAGEHVLPFLKGRLSRWAAEADDEAIRNALDLITGLPIAGRLELLPDWFRLLEHDHPTIRWTALYEGREFVLVSMMAGGDSMTFSTVAARIRELALHDPDPDVREEAAACLSGFPVPEEGASPLPAEHCD